MNVLLILLVCELRFLGVDELKHLVPSLLHHCDFREKLIRNDQVRSLEVDINSRLITSRFKSNVRENSSWKSIRIEILNLTVVELESRIHITCSLIGILVIVQVQLTELSHVPPSVIVDQWPKCACKLYVELGSSINVFL